MIQILKVVMQGEVVQLDTPNGENKKRNKCTLVLQALGGKYADTFVCTMFDKDANSNFYAGELVTASIHFYTHEYKGVYYQDIVVEDIVKLRS